jgi:hypothetical protein
MYSSLLEKFNDEETVFEENILSSNCFFLHFFQQTLVQIKSHLTKCSQFSSTEGLYYHQQALWRYGTIVLF